MKYYNFGSPFETESVVNFEGIRKCDTLEELIGSTGLYVEANEEVKIMVNLGKSDVIYGLGENLRGINKRGGIYESFCTDDPNHSPDKRALYGAHNFFIVDGEKPIGVYIDFPSKVTFDMGFTHKDKIEVTVHGKDFRLYVIESSDKTGIVSNYLKAIGPSFLPPRWAFGFQQSRWSYPDAEAINDIADKFIESDIPCDTIYMDIDYMEDFKNFTVNEERFPDFKNFVSDIKDKGFRLIPIIDAGCKMEDGYFVHEEGVNADFYCVDDKGKPFVGAVWPGKVHFPDFINPAARDWFGEKYNILINQGIEGFWNDMNEPAIFYSERGLNEAISYAAEMEGKNLGIYEFFDLKDKFLGISNSNKDYQAFYHRVDGKTYNHYDLHNIYGYNMTRAAGEAFEKYHPEKRILLFSRASYTGMHRYGGIWTGDNHSWWQHLIQNVRMMPALNMSGFLYSGADIGGFGGHADGELLTRWSQFSVYTPLFRNHACMGTRHQEPFSFEDDTTKTMRNIIRYRYAQVHHLYSEFMKARLNNRLLFRPLSFDYKDDFVEQVEDQLLFGDSLMLAPVENANARGRYVYLPEEMLLWRLRSENDYDLEITSKGHEYIKADTHEWLSFIRRNRLVLLNEVKNSVDDIEMNEMTCVGYIEDEGVYRLYHDDGISRQPEAKYFELKVDYKDGLIFSHTGDIGCNTINYDIMTTDNKRHKGVYHV